MANTDKNVLITPNIGSSTAAPKIELTGADGTGSDKITLTSSFDGSVSTLSFEGTSGQLFSISNLDSDGDENLFAVNDKSGIPSLQVATDGTVILNPNSGRVLIGTAVDDGVNQLQVDGTLSVSGSFINSGDISFGDNAKAIFGTGSDLQIYHDGNHSRIVESGSGDMIIQGDEFSLMNVAGTEYMIFADNDSFVKLYYDGSAKLSTIATGISVTGDVVTTASIAKTTGGSMLRAAISAWTTAPNHDILYYSSSTNNGDYLYLKVPENGTVGHPTLAMTEQGGLFYGTWDNESGALFDVTTAPITNNLFRIDTAGNVTISGDLTVAGSQTSTGTAELNVTDIFITLNDGETGPGITAPAGLSGIKIDRGPQSDSAEWLFNETTDKWTSNFPLGITGGSSTFTGGSMTVISDGSDAAGAEINLKHANNNVNDVVSTVNFSNNIGSVARIQGGTVGANNSGYIDFFTDNAGVDGFVARMLPNGNLGIGTNDPKQKVHSTNGFYTTGGIATPGSPPYSSYSGASFDWFDGYARLASWGADATTRGGYSFIQMQSDGESQQTALSIAPSGKVSIGTIAGTVEKLSVKSTGTQDGQIILEHSGNANPIVQIGQSNNHGSIKISTNGGVVNTYLGASANENYINASTRSNLGVGTTNPDELLHVFDSFNNAGTETTLGTTTSRATIKVENDATQEGAYASLFLRAGTADARIAAINAGATDNTADLVFIVDDTVNSGTERMRIVGETGNVGIGTNSPTTTLDLTNTSDTAERAIRIENNSARLYVGVEGAAGNRFFGSAVGNGFIGTTTAHGLELGTNNNVRMRIDVSGNVGLGAVPSAWGSLWKASEIGLGAGFGGRTNGTQADVYENLYRDATNAYTYKTSAAGSLYTQVVGNFIWSNAGVGTAGATATLAERMRIDPNGNLLVGTTDTTPYNNTSGGGFVVASNGLTSIARETTASNQTVLHLNNTGVNGIIAEFAKDGATVGSIVTDGGDLAIGTGNTKLRFNDVSDAIYSGGGDGSGTNAGTDLGTSDYKFGDLHLSGGVYSNSLNINQAKPYTPAHFKAIGDATGPTDVLTIETYRNDVGDDFTGGSIVFVNSDTNSAGQARIKVGSANDPAPIGLNNEVVQSFIFETSTQGTATTSNIDGNATTITVTHTAASLVVGQRIAITAGNYAGSYTIDTVLSSTQFTIADTAHNLAADTTSRTVQYGIPRDSMIIRADGNVGIGTDDPSKLLTVSGDDAEFLINRTGVFADTINIGMPSGVPTIVGGTDLAFGGTGTWAEHMRIKADGNVGIGTSSPGFKLHVSDNSGAGVVTGGILVENTGTTTGEANLAFKNQDTGSNYWFTGLNQDTNYALNYGTAFSDPNNLFTLTSGGNLGVGGDPDPNERLVVTNSANGGSTAIVVQNEYSLASSVNESTDLQFRFYNAGSTSFSSGAMIRSTKTEDWMTTAAASAELVFYTRKDNVLARKMTLDPNGNLLIGASGTLSSGNQVAIQPTGHIRAQHVTGEAGDTLIGAITGVSNGFQIIHDTSNNQTYKFHTGGVESLGILPSGYVRINGTSGPTLFGTVAVATTISSTEVYSFDKTLYGGAKFIVTIEDSNGTDRQIVELLVVHDGTNAFSTQYGSVLTTGTELATFDVDINGNNVRLLASGHTANSHQYHTSAHLMAL